MTRAVWDKLDERFYYTGVSHVMLFLQDADGTYPLGVPWSGVTEISESPEGGEPSPTYADDIIYANPRSAEQHGGSITCYDYPDEFSQCNGEVSGGSKGGVTFGQQSRRSFGFTYESRVGNNTKGTDYGKTLTIVYNASVNPSESTHSTMNEDPELQELSFDYTCTSIEFPFGLKPAATITIDTTLLSETEKTAFATLEDIIYGSDTTEPRLPSPYEVATTMGITSL